MHTVTSVKGGAEDKAGSKRPMEMRFVDRIFNSCIHGFSFKFNISRFGPKMHDHYDDFQNQWVNSLSKPVLQTV